MGFFTSFSWRKSIVLLLVAVLLTGLAFAVRYGEDNQVGSSNEVSWWVFVAAGVSGYWSLLGFAVSAFKSVSGGNGADGRIDDGEDGKDVGS